MTNVLGQYEELQENVTLAFALKAQELGHGTITDSGYFVAEYPYYDAQYNKVAVYPIIK